MYFVPYIDIGGHISHNELTKCHDLMNRSKFLREDAIVADHGFTMSGLLKNQTEFNHNHPSPTVSARQERLMEKVIVIRQVVTM